MTLTISNNSAVASASYYLGKNQKALQLSIKKLASGKRVIGGAEDPGTLSVTMKLNASVTRLTGARNNVQNAQKKVCLFGYFLNCKSIFFFIKIM